MAHKANNIADAETQDLLTGEEAETQLSGQVEMEAERDSDDDSRSENNRPKSKTSEASDKKPKTEELQKAKKANEYVTITATYISNSEFTMQFRMRRTSDFKKLMARFCKQFNLHHSAKFLYDGERIDNLTPEQLEMENGKEYDVEVHCTQSGGHGHRDLMLY